MEHQRGRNMPTRVIRSPSWNNNNNNNYAHNDNYRNSRFRGDQYRNNNRGDRSRNNNNNNSSSSSVFRGKGNCSFQLRATLSTGDATGGSPPQHLRRQLQQQQQDCEEPPKLHMCMSYPGVQTFPEVGVLGAPALPVFQVHAPQPADAVNSYQTLSVTPSPLGHVAYPDPGLAPAAGGLGSEFRRVSPEDDGYRLMVTMPVGYRPDGTYGVLETFDPYQSYRMAPYYINRYTYHNATETLNNGELVPYNPLM